MKMIDVGRRGKFYTLNGEVVKPDKFIGVGGFKWINHIWAFIRGGAHGEGGGVHLTRAKQYVEEEVLGNGAQRMRAPIENMMWTKPYFNLDPTIQAPYNKPNVANTLANVNLNVGTGSGFSLTPGLKKAVRMMINIAREYEIVVEAPWLWTIKTEAKGEAADRLGFDDDPRRRFDRGETNGVAIWNEHFMAAHGIGAYLHELRTVGDGEGIHRVDPGPLNLIHDCMNEYTAHVPLPPWPEDVLRAVARRWRERDAPHEEIFLISQSGPADTYDPPLQSRHGTNGYSGPCQHPPRGGEWDKTGNIIRETFPGELCDVNESQMGMTQGQRNFWVPLIPKWAGLGSTDMAKWARMHENFIENDIYTTFHTFRGMDGGWPMTPETVVEETMRGITGGGGVTPPPEPKVLYRVPIELGYAELLERHVDPGGLKSYNEAMINGMDEHVFRQQLIDSDEFKNKNS